MPTFVPFFLRTRLAMRRSADAVTFKIVALLVMLVGCGCGHDDGMDLDRLSLSPHVGLWCGVGSNVPDDGNWCLLVCDTGRANFGNLLDESAAESSDQYFRFTYREPNLRLMYQDGVEIVIGFETSETSGTVTVPKHGAFRVERVGFALELCESETATQYETPYS